jgi:hypothetical protein
LNLRKIVLKNGKRIGEQPSIFGKRKIGKKRLTKYLTPFKAFRPL